MNRIKELFRALHFAELLCEAGNQVIFISSNFIHREKRFRNHPCDKQIQTKKENLKIYLLKGFGYRKNISVSRLLHDIKLASNFVTSVKKSFKARCNHLFVSKHLYFVASCRLRDTT